SAPAPAHSRRRFSVTCSVSSSVRRPRLSESKGGPLTPPRRVENATTYCPGGSQRRSGTWVSLTLLRSARARRRAPTRGRRAPRSASGGAARGEPVPSRVTPEGPVLQGLPPSPRDERTAALRSSGGAQERPRAPARAAVRRA